MLTPDLSLSRRFIDHRPPPGRLVQCAITGAHIYGFPSEDSDIDIKGIHLAPLEEVLGLDRLHESHDALEIFEGTECDLTTHEAKVALRLLIEGNGNMLERLTSRYQLVEGTEELADLARASLSKRSFRHYAGYLRGMRREHDKKHRAKTALYCYRVALTGIHLLRAGEVEADVNRLAPMYGEDVSELVAFKREHGEKCSLPADLEAHHLARFDGLERKLADARDASPLPEEAPNRAAIADWLVRERLSSV